MMVHHCTVHVFLFSYLIDKYSARIITETGKIMNTITKKLPKGLTSTSLSSMYITEPAETFFFWGGGSNYQYKSKIGGALIECNLMKKFLLRT